MVVVKDIDLYSLCEHHLLPFMGTAHVAYLPNGKVVGLSKIPRVVESLARQAHAQGRMAARSAAMLVTDPGARGVAAILEATHTCMSIRGVRKTGSLTTTSAMRGTFRSNP